MFDWLRSIFNKDSNNRIKIRLKLEHKNNAPHDETPFIWCLIGNIVNEHYSGIEKKIEYGTKHFSPNTKVYCFPIQWGDGYENIKVIGKHRRTNRNICIIMPSKYIINWRLQKVYQPHVLKLMHLQKGWTNSDQDKDTIIEMLKWLPKNNGK